MRFLVTCGEVACVNVNHLPVGPDEPRPSVQTFRGAAPDAAKALAALVVVTEREDIPSPSGRRGGPTFDDLGQEYWRYAEEQGRAHSNLVNHRSARY